MSPTSRPTPRVVVTLADVARSTDPARAAAANARYLAAMTRHGAAVMALDATVPLAERAAALASMDGLLLSGGVDLAPERYGGPASGAEHPDPDRDELEAAAWAAAEARGVPVLGICRGLQAMNVFAGGRLLQHVDGHDGTDKEAGSDRMHPLRVVPGTRLARILYPTNVGGGVLTVNSRHRQAVRREDLAARFVASATAPSRAGELVEGFEAPSGPFRMAVQCHPERTESSPAAFERLFAFFVDACRGPLASR